SGLGGPGGDAGGGEGGAPGGGPGGGNPGGNPGGGNSGGNSGGGNSGGNSGGGDSGGGDSGGDSGGDDSGEDPGPEPEPLSIGAALDTVLPGGQCFASGTISVSGGAYPVTVHYQWRRTALVDGQLTYLAVSPVRNITFDAPGSQSIQVNN